MSEADPDLGAIDWNIRHYTRLAGTHQDMADHFTQSAAEHLAMASYWLTQRNQYLGHSALENVVPLHDVAGGSVA